jgi:hypothetical protein
MREKGTARAVGRGAQAHIVRTVSLRATMSENAIDHCDTKRSAWCSLFRPLPDGSVGLTCPPKTLPAIIEDSPDKRRRGVLKREEDAA